MPMSSLLHASSHVTRLYPGANLPAAVYHIIEHYTPLTHGLTAATLAAHHGRETLSSMATSAMDRDAILRAIETWPLEDQLTLAHAILRRSQPPAGAQRPGWRELAGLVATGGPPPSDQEIERWLDEHRSEKYG
jgi:hypothetical protein